MRFRSLLVLALLCGYYVIAAAVVVFTGWSLVRAFADPGLWTLPLVPAGLLLCFVVVPPLVRAHLVRGPEPDGQVVERGAEPVLWGVVDEVAAQMRVRRPHEIRFVAVVTARIGLAPRGRRCLTIGLPLLETLSAAQFRAVLCHEFGRQRGFGLLHLRAAPVLDRALQGYAAPLLGWYVALYHRAASTLARQREIEADLAGARLTGKNTTIGALIAVATTAEAWRLFGERWARPAARYRLAPDDLFGGFRTFLAERQDVAEVPAFADAYDTHSPLRERVKAVGRAPFTARELDDPRRARALLTDPARLERSLELHTPGRTRLPWTALMARIAELSAADEAARLLGAVGRLEGVSTPTLKTVIVALERGMGPQLAVRLGGEAVLDQALSALLRSALLATGQFSWAEQSRVPVHTGGPATHLPAQSLKAAVDLFGVDPDYRPHPGFEGMDPLRVLHAVQVSGELFDVLVLDLGLLLVRSSPEHLLALPLDVLLARPGNRLVAESDILRADLRVSGTQWRLDLHCQAEDLVLSGPDSPDDVFHACVALLGTRAARV